MITYNYLKAVKLANLLACLVLLVLSTSLGSLGQVRAQGLDNPLLFKLGEKNKADLFDNEEIHLKISLPAGRFKILLDTRRNDWKYSNLGGALSILNGDGTAWEQRAIRVIELDILARKSYAFSLKSPSTFILKLTNDNRVRQLFWLTVLQEPTRGFIPFVGEITPKPLTLGQPESGTLDQDEYIFYTTKVKRGDYNVVLDFTPTAGRNVNVNGYFATLDGDGSNQKKLFTINELGNKLVRKTGTFAARGETMMVFKVHSGTKVYGGKTQVNYKLTIEPAGPESGRQE
jgi:hypothetical protein